MLHGRQRRRSILGRISPFVVLSDMTISVIVCLSVALAFLAQSHPADRTRELEQQIKTLKDELKNARNEVPKEIRENQEDIKKRLQGAVDSCTVVTTYDSQVIRFGSSVLFGVSEAALQQEGHVALDGLYRVLSDVIRARAGTDGRVAEVQIQGHTDATGSYRQDNLPLAVKRAEAVRDYLLSRASHDGNAGFRRYLSVAAYAWHRPAANNGARDAAENRRIDIRIYFHRPGLTGPPPVIEPADWPGE